ncbi:D-aminoacyl-tRNA deacylase [Christensenella tenuis]|jgi:D-aminoacyl-tRNA deacylase|uniref:D-aminoacyl-tRNA deacylase n=1 Tax=Christensenella tenuis TaxID=2763033 RepID=A0ABR7EDC3_9FIRM|nr:D-aminoacyl-tRNA deacylase [Christensenella tenuis]MBC5647104.1 D-tyrosyl-tRNA(Tyr) deacylase [Christensenella tenuis]
MRAVVQRVKNASVYVDGEAISQIGTGLVVLIGISSEDSDRDMEYIAEKCVNLRIFEDAGDVMNLSVKDIGGEILLVSQFTLYGDARKGRRPSYIKAATPDAARDLFEKCVYLFRKKYEKIQIGKFQAEMQVSLVNDGPVTILLDSKKEF